MGLMRRALGGAVGGIGGTLALTGFREVLSALGLVGATAPRQVVQRLEELGLLDGWSPGARRALVVAAHVAYGVGTGTALGLVRRRRGGATEEAAVGSALGLLAWGTGWPVGCRSPGFTCRPGSSKAPRCS